SELSTAYTNFVYPRSVADTVKRTVQGFNRAVVYLRAAGTFVVFDRVKIRASTHPNGPYDYQLRWNLAGVPTVQGNLVSITHGASAMTIQTVLPATATTTTVHLLNNPDNTWGPDANYLFKADLYRAEVRDPTRPLGTTFLTAIQAGPSGMAPMNATPLASQDSSLLGAFLDVTGSPQVVMFNNGPGVAPAPVTFANYPLAGPLTATHTLLGVQPGAAYKVTRSNDAVQITLDPAGSLVASAAGVLRFQASALPFEAKTWVQFGKATLAATEGGSALQIPVTILTPSPVAATTVTVALTGGTGSAADVGTFTPPTVTFPAGSTAPQMLTVPVTDDPVAEPTETLVFALQSASGGLNAGVGQPAQLTVTLSDNDINQPPAFIAVLASKTVTVGTAVPFTYAASDPEGGPITYSTVSVPSGATLNATTGAFSYTPWSAGTYTVTVKATDYFGASVTTTATITAQAGSNGGGGGGSGKVNWAPHKALVKWLFDDQNLVADGGTAPNVTRVFGFNTTPGAYASGVMGSGTFSPSATGWANGAGVRYWQADVTTTGYEGIRISFYQCSSNAGPRDFKLQYSIDGGPWTDVPNGIVPTLTTGLGSGGKLRDFKLPVALANKALVSIRWIMTSNTSVGGGTVTDAGTSRIDDVVIEGQPMPSTNQIGEADLLAPGTTFLAPPSPNPFLVATRLTVGMAEAGHARLVVYDAVGREVVRLMDGPLPAGLHEFALEAADLTSGLYLVRLDAPGVHVTRQVLLMR
ncbi:MAG TPA: putative Ig domain-containing protein, partial [Rhodothermales bacterium]|nr:putative Ig domain-containing protein [Rhodothermales bacterium]